MYRSRKGGIGHGTYSPVSLYDTSLYGGVQGGFLQSPGISRGGNEIIGCSSVPTDSSLDTLHFECKFLWSLGSCFQFIFY